MKIADKQIQQEVQRLYKNYMLLGSHFFYYGDHQIYNDKEAYKETKQFMRNNGIEIKKMFKKTFVGFSLRQILFNQTDIGWCTISAILILLTFAYNL